MAAELADRFGVQPELVRGAGGVFEVTVDGELLFSKRATGRFPEAGEVAERIARRIPTPQPLRRQP
ncbi:MAG: SelT/SelW/SelH family protein [Nitrospirae bacterium]|nr:MAG: SelT/SelW/SelH family protein [Nitrospirota bacterium]